MAKLANPGELFTETGLSKYQKKQLEVADATIKCFDRHSIEGTHFGHVAEEMGVTRPLIKHYFADKDELAAFVIKYIRLQYQQAVMDKVATAKTAKERMQFYIDEVLKWPQQKKMHARVWCNFLQICSRDKSQMEIHDGYVRATQERIAGFLSDLNGREPEKNLRPAKLIEVLLSGALLTLLTESLPEREQVLEDAESLIWKIAQG